MRVAVEKIEGVSEASVSLEEGEVELVLQEDNRLTLARLREVIRDRGFTPREADVRARGVPVREGGVWLFRVSGTEGVHAVEASAEVLEELAAREGDAVVVRGEVAQGDEAPLRILSIDR